MSETSKRWKVFLCYAREDQVLMDDFRDRFSIYNRRDMEILNDRDPNSDNMHGLFHQWANECKAAVLLVNARFVDPEGYASQYEIPVLLERQREGEVVLIGVRFSNVSDLEGWNEEGDIFFFSLTNNDLPYTRSKNEKSSEFLRKFAVYKQIDDKDLDDFHDRLRQWVKECLRKKFGNVERASKSFIGIPLRPQEETEQILDEMNQNSLLYKLEKRLSEDRSFWDESGIVVPVATEMYAFWYCLNQADEYGKLQTSLCQLTPEDPLRRLTTFFEKVERRNATIHRLLGEDYTDEEELDVQLSDCLFSVDNVLEASMAKVIEAPRKNHTEAKSKLVDAIEELRMILKLIGGGSLGGS